MFDSFDCSSADSRNHSLVLVMDFWGFDVCDVDSLHLCQVIRIDIKLVCSLNHFSARNLYHSFTWHEHLLFNDRLLFYSRFLYCCRRQPLYSSDHCLTRFIRYKFFVVVGFGFCFGPICKKPQNKYEINHLHKKLIESSFMCISLHVYSQSED